MATGLTAPALPSPALAPPQPGQAPAPLGQDPRCAHPGVQLLSAWCSGSGDLAQNCAPANFLLPFPFHKAVLLTNKLSNSLAHILALLNQTRAAAPPLAPVPKGQLRRRGCRVPPVTPSRCPGGRHLPILCARLSGKRQSPHTAHHPNLSMVSERSGEERTEESERASERRWSVPARWAGELERTGQGGRPEPVGGWGLAGQ